VAVSIGRQYPRQAWLAACVGLGAGAVLAAGLWRAHQQQYVPLGWVGGVLGGFGCFLLPFVSTDRWRAAFARGQILVFVVGFVLLDQLRRGHLHYPRAEGLLFAGGGLTACAVLMAREAATRPRERLALLAEAGLLENPRAFDLLTRYLAHLERVREDTVADAATIRRVVKDVRRRRCRDAAEIRALVAALDRIQAACEAERPLELEPLADLDRAALTRYRKFFLGLADELERSGGIRWRFRGECRWREVMWELVEGQRAWHEAIAMLARHHRVPLPAWIVRERRRLARAFIL
jgi:hypothetical protein